jgi:hypothetical protein
MRHAFTCQLLLLAVLGLTLGCGESHPPVAPVAGKVTYKGQPCTAGRLLFLPVGGGKQGLGAIQPDGSFRISTFGDGDGALVGTHNVLILNVATVPDAKEALTFKLAKSAPIAIKADAPNELVIALPADNWKQD